MTEVAAEHLPHRPPAVPVNSVLGQRRDVLVLRESVDDVGEVSIGGENQALGVLSREVPGPTTDNLRKGSRCRRIREVVPGPATRSSAAIVSATRIDGQVDDPAPAQLFCEQVMRVQKVTDNRARRHQPSDVSGLTGQTASSPCSGWRMTPLAKLEAARLGLPGRTTLVGSQR